MISLGIGIMENIHGIDRIMTKNALEKSFSGLHTIGFVPDLLIRAALRKNSIIIKMNQMRMI